jgi:hypothetical protein
MRVCASIWSRGRDIVIPDMVVPGLDGISWGKTCKGAPVVEDLRTKGFVLHLHPGKSYHFYSMFSVHCGLLV